MDNQFWVTLYTIVGYALPFIYLTFLALRWYAGWALLSFSKIMWVVFAIKTHNYDNYNALLPFILGLIGMVWWLRNRPTRWTWIDGTLAWQWVVGLSVFVLSLALMLTNNHGNSMPEIQDDLADALFVAGYTFIMFGSLFGWIVLLLVHLFYLNDGTGPMMTSMEWIRLIIFVVPFIVASVGVLIKNRKEIFRSNT